MPRERTLVASDFGASAEQWTAWLEAADKRNQTLQDWLRDAGDAAVAAQKRDQRGRGKAPKPSSSKAGKPSALLGLDEKRARLMGHE